MPKPQAANKLVATSGDDTLDRRGFSAEYTIDGLAGNDTIYGGDGRDRLYGGRGDDLIYASTQDILIDGGGGVDTASFLYSGTGVRVELWDGGLGSWGVADPNSTYRSRVLKAENVDGSDHDDHIAGSRGVNRLDGGAGNDSLLAWGSGDFLTGGAGADKFFVSAGAENLTITDFHYNEGDRIDLDFSPQFDWVDGFAPDADGNMQQAWTGTCDLLSGGTMTIVVLGADTVPSGDWFI